MLAPYQKCDLQTFFFFHFMGWHFTFLIVSFETPKFLMSLKSNLSIFNLVALLLMSYLRNYCLLQAYKDIHLRGPERGPQPIASKKMGTSVLKPEGNKFFQQPVSLERTLNQPCHPSPSKRTEPSADT